MDIILYVHKSYQYKDLIEYAGWGAGELCLKLYDILFYWIKSYFADTSVKKHANVLMTSSLSIYVVCAQEECIDVMNIFLGW